MSKKTNSHQRIKPGLLLLTRIGLVAAVVGIGLFVFAGALASYELSPQVLSKLSAAKGSPLKKNDKAFVLAELKPLVGKRYGSVFGFVGDLKAALQKANKNSGWKIYDYQRGVYAYSITRASSTGFGPNNVELLFLLTFVLASLGALVSFVPRAFREPAGIKNHGVMFSKLKSRGWIGIGFGTLLIAFYIVLYFYPSYMVNWIRLADPISEALKGTPADRWFFYGTLYTFSVVVMGVRMLINYRHSRYHIVRTISVIFFQLGFAFLLPAILAALNKPAPDFKLAWPLDYSFFYSYRIDGLTGSSFGWFVLLWGIGLAFIVVPFLSAFVGKRWYCSWVCGCGGLAETLGDPFRHQSNKSLRAWRIERWVIHTVLVLAVVMTGIVVANYLTGGSKGGFLAQHTWKVQKWYGFFIGSIFAGVIGTGFYPLMGNRVWCRFGCPLAAILGMVQKVKSRFRITTNGGQCISCGNCSTYCEMGIDVRWYAQRGQNIVRSSCVGCGVCAAVCPRGVLRLENGPLEGRNNTHSLAQLNGGKIDI
jgi:ferredoxin-type protein NapH